MGQQCFLDSCQWEEESKLVFEGQRNDSVDRNFFVERTTNQTEFFIFSTTKLNAFTKFNNFFK